MLVNIAHATWPLRTSARVNDYFEKEASGVYDKVTDLWDDLASCASTVRSPCPFMEVQHHRSLFVFNLRCTSNCLLFPD